MKKSRSSAENLVIAMLLHGQPNGVLADALGVSKRSVQRYRTIIKRAREKAVEIAEMLSKV